MKNTFQFFGFFIIVRVLLLISFTTSGQNHQAILQSSIEPTGLYQSQQDGYVRHIVAKGETVYRISVNYKVKPEDLCRWNNIKNNAISPGQVLTINLANTNIQHNDNPLENPLKSTNIAKEKSSEVNVGNVLTTESKPFVTSSFNNINDNSVSVSSSELKSSTETYIKTEDVFSADFDETEIVLSPQDTFKSKQVETDYSRSAITVLFSNLGDCARYPLFIRSLNDSVLRLDKFDYNGIGEFDFVTSAKFSDSTLYDSSNYGLLANSKLLDGNTLISKIPSAVSSCAVINCYQVNPANPREYYTGLANIGLYYTRDSGQVFETVVDCVRDSLMIGDFHVDWSTNNIWLGTRLPEKSNTLIAANSKGVLFSNNAGKSWSRSGLTTACNITRIIVHPTDPKTAWIAVRGESYLPCRERGIYKTTDGGITWRNVLFVDDTTGSFDLAISSYSPDTLYATFWNLDKNADGMIASNNFTGVQRKVVPLIAQVVETGILPGNCGVYSSFDGGEKWTKVLKTEPAPYIDPLAKKVLQDIRRQKVANKVISGLFDVSADGNFSMNEVSRRGMYDASKFDMQLASASKRGVSELQQSGINLLSNMYVVVIGIDNIVTKEEVYDKEDNENRAYAAKYKTEFNPVKRYERGFEATASAYLYKIQMTDSMMSVFWQDYFSDSSTFPDPNERMKRYRKMMVSKLPVRYITYTSASGSGTQLKIEKPQLSDSELMAQLSSNLLGNAMRELENSVEDFQVRARIAKMNPIRIEIGAKEGLKRSDRYFVYESVMDDNGSVNSERRGVIRAKKVVDNRKNVTEFGSEVPASTFYQISGKRLDLDMIAKQKNDLGIGIGGLAGTASGIRLQVLLTNIIHDLPTETYLTADVTISNISTTYQDFQMDSSGVFPYLNGNWFEVTSDFAIEKRFMLTKRLHFGVSGGYSSSWVTKTIDELEYLVIGGGINYGITLGRNCGSNLTIGVFARNRSISYFDYKVTDSAGNQSEAIPLDYSVGFDNTYSGLKFGAMAIFSF